MGAAGRGRTLARRRGSSSTYQQIVGQARRLAEIITGLGFQITSVDQLREKHFRAAFKKLKADGLKQGTLQNYSRTARYVMTGAGKTTMATALGNFELGVDGRCRDGTKTATTDETLTEVAARVARIRNRNRAVRLDYCIQFSRLTGARIREAQRSGPQLEFWHQTLLPRGTIFMRDGTKNGRDRTILIREEDRAELLALIELGLTLRDTEGRIWLWGTALKGALRSLTAAGKSVGLHGRESWHALRYRFAQTQMTMYLSLGLQRDAALAQISMDLGHGDQRGRYVEQVYFK